MSNYEREHGSYVIPSSEWQAFKTKIVCDYNAIQERKYKCLLRIYESLKKMGQGKRKFDYAAALSDIERSNEILSNFRSFYSFSPYRKAGIYADLILFNSEDNFSELVLHKETGKPRLPKKNDFPQIGVSSAKIHIGVGDYGVISLNKETRTVLWNVSENNHSVKSARSEPMAKSFFRAIESVKWGRNSGGYIKYTSEHDVDADGFRRDPSIGNHHGSIGARELGIEYGDALKRMPRKTRVNNGLSR